jgi:plastocyanin
MGLTGGWTWVLFFATIVAVLVLGGCSDSSSNLGKFVRGRTLHLNVVAIEMVPELRYATIDPKEVVREWRLVPSSADLELVLVRMKVENHTAVSAIVTVDQQAAELRDFLGGGYFPVDLSARLYQDLRERSEITVRVREGQCFDPNRMYVTQGTTVRWTNDDTAVQYLDLGPGGADTRTLNPGESYSRAFNEAAAFDYACSAEDTDPHPARIEVHPAASGTLVELRSVLFIDGSFELLRGTGIDGWLVFEAPPGTEFRDLRWRAGDTITYQLDAGT